jgi:hypothetical protein
MAIGGAAGRMARVEWGSVINLMILLQANAHVIQVNRALVSGGDACATSTVYKRTRAFRFARTSPKDLPRSGRPTLEDSVDQALLFMSIHKKPSSRIVFDGRSF